MLMKDGFRNGRPGELITHRTMLGWVLLETFDPKYHTQQDQVTNFHTTVVPDVTEDALYAWSNASGI